MAKTFTVTPVRRVNASERRSVAFLSCDEDAEINGKAVFDPMTGTPRNNVMNRFDHWVGCHVHDQYHHGWPGHPRYGDCYSFRWYQGKARHRFYGFKYNPMPNTNQGFQVCVLVSHARKFTDSTDTSELERAVRLRGNKNVVAAGDVPSPVETRRRLSDSVSHVISVSAASV